MPTAHRPTGKASHPAPVVFLFDVDNTLLDNDQITRDLRRHLNQCVGPESQERYWVIFEQLRTELGYADYLGALQRYRNENQSDPNILKLSLFLLEYPFQSRLYANALKVLERLSKFGPTVILSDGDVIFQPWKVKQSGLYAAVDDRVLIYVHKEHQLDDVERRFPSAHYVLIDDKVRILDAAKKIWGDKLTTVFARQGHYALDPELVSQYPTPDVTIDTIETLLDLEPHRLFPTA